ncbi:type II/IV secretion system protein [Candidatus Berkelbacteria bacterium]|nr:type II/IV secretion system protein [Candidatus Berkelbacteria bacterium]
MKIDDAKLLEILEKESYVAAEEIKKAAQFIKDHETSATDYLLTAGLVTTDLLGQAISESLKVPFADLDSRPPANDLVSRLPASFARKYRVVLFDEDPKSVTLASDDPLDKKYQAEAKSIFSKKKVIFAYGNPGAIDEVLLSYRKPLDTQTNQIIKSGERVAPAIIDAIIDDALAFRASDIHIEPGEDEVVIRLRVDGLLQEAGRLSLDFYENILNRIKVQTQMRIDEHASAQDGAMRYEKDGHIIDLRVSIAPILTGEKVVMRVLAEYVRSFGLGNLGLTADQQNMFLSSGKKPFGMIMVTGPTGSGKTTSLYSLIKLLNKPEVNITTIEEPVEYKIPGINQIQVNKQTNLTFAEGLKSIVRQDPDIILVGEIRDEETSQIAVNAALTGHLLLTTFHANDAATAIPRLLDMGIEPFLLASTLELIVAQRLVRKICANCRYSQTVPLAQIEEKLPGAKNFFDEKMVTLYAGKGCKACNGNGFKGRTAVFEFIHISNNLKELILTNPSNKDVVELARQEGTASMFEDGLDKVKNGITTLGELLRVTEPPTYINVKKAKPKTRKK